MRERRVRRESPRCNFSRPSVFANFEAHGIISREFWDAAKPLTRPQRICEPCQPGAPSRERTRNCKSAEQMDACNTRGRTALVERRERFYRLGNRLSGHLAPLFPKIQFLKYTKRVSRGLFLWDLLATPGPRKEQTPYRPTRLAHRASLVGLERTGVGSRIRGPPPDDRTRRDNRFRQFGGAPQLP